MGTFVEITIPEKNDELLEGTVEKMKSLEALMSIYKKGQRSKSDKFIGER